MKTKPLSRRPLESISEADQFVLVRNLPGSMREDLDNAPFWKEVRAFSHIPQSELDAYYGRYVAIYQGNIVDSDAEEALLADRFYRAFGYVTVYIHKVGVEDALINLESDSIV